MVNHLQIDYLNSLGKLNLKRLKVFDNLDGYKSKSLKRNGVSILIQNTQSV